MSIRDLADFIQTFLPTQGQTAVVGFDYPSRDEQINQGPGGANRVVVELGDEQGNCGELVPPDGQEDAYQVDDNGIPILTNQSGNRRLLGEERIYTFRVWGPVADKNDRARCIDDGLGLRDDVLRALQEYAPGDWVFGKWSRVPPVERVFGLEISFVATMRRHIDDVPPLVVTGPNSITPDPPVQEE